MCEYYFQETESSLLLTASILTLGPQSRVSSNTVAIILLILDRGMKATT